MLDKIGKVVYEAVNDAFTNSNKLIDIINQFAKISPENNTRFYIKLYFKKAQGTDGWSSKTTVKDETGVVPIIPLKKTNSLDVLSKVIKKVLEPIETSIYKSYGSVRSYEYYICYLYDNEENKCWEVAQFVRDNGTRGVSVDQNMPLSFFPEYKELQIPVTYNDITIPEVLKKYKTNDNINDVLLSRTNPLKKLAAILTLTDMRSVSEGTVKFLCKKAGNKISLKDFPIYCGSGCVEEIEINKANKLVMWLYIQNYSTDTTVSETFSNFFLRNTYRYEKRGNNRYEDFSCVYSPELQLKVLKSILIACLYKLYKSDKLPDKESVGYFIE